MNEYTARDRKNYGDTDIAKVAYPKFLEKLSVCRDPVSYTHLDVYKRQLLSFIENTTSNTVKLGDYLYIKGRIGWKGLKKEEYLEHSDYRIINGESLTKAGIDWSKAGYISQARYDESPEIMLQNGDILLSKDGTIGKIGRCV